MMAMSMPNPILEGADEAKNEHGADDDETKMKRVRAYAFSESPFRRISTAAAFVWIWAKLGRRVRAAQKRVAEQFGNALCAFSLCDAVVQTLLMFAMGEDAVPSLVLDYAIFPLSAAAVVTHFSSRLPYERVTSFWFHVGSFVLRAFARGAHKARLHDWFGGAYHGLFWPALIACTAITMHRLRRVVQQAASPTLGSRAASVGLVGSVIGLPPLLYLCFNSAACLVFAAAPRETCGTRIEANYALTMTLVFSNLLPVLLVFEPISPQQIMRLEGLAWHHFVAAAFGAVSFVCVITLASTHERFEPVTSFLYYTARASYALAFVGVVVFGAGVVNLSSRAGGVLAARLRAHDHARGVTGNVARGPVTFYFRGPPPITPCSHLRARRLQVPCLS